MEKPHSEATPSHTKHLSHIVSPTQSSHRTSTLTKWTNYTDLLFYILARTRSILLNIGTQLDTSCSLLL